MTVYIIVAAVAYALGSIPFGYLLVKLSGGGDIRQTGSGNIGATNVARKNPALGVLTLLLDAAKGYVAVVVSSYFLRAAIASAESDGLPAPDLYVGVALAALFAVIGHVFTVWLGFKGGKGVATGVGSFLALAPKAVLVALAIFVLLVAVFRYVSLGSIVGSAAFPVAAWFLQPEMRVTPVLLAAVASLLIVVKHHQNIRRLVAGSENKLGAKRA